jgi:hypothetical protein
MIDKFNDKGGNGGAASELNCGAGYKIAGYTTLVSLQVCYIIIIRTAAHCCGPFVNGTIGHKRANAS